jgi:hypothetical protein
MDQAKELVAPSPAASSTLQDGHGRDDHGCLPWTRQPWTLAGVGSRRGRREAKRERWRRTRTAQAGHSDKENKDVHGHVLELPPSPDHHGSIMLSLVKEAFCVVEIRPVVSFSQAPTPPRSPRRDPAMRWRHGRQPLLLQFAVVGEGASGCVWG